ncbi:MAG: CsgG/HfaB family protein, partial [Candidatus Binatia bacterium]
MQRTFLRWLAPAVCLALLWPSTARANKATIAVLPFEVGAAQSPIETSVLIDAFNRVLVNSRKFTVVDRARVDRTRREQKFGRSGLVSAASAASVGRLLGAQFLVMGTLLDYTIEPPREMAYGSGWMRPVRISVNVQVVDASSGQIVAARRASGLSQRRMPSRDSAAVVSGVDLEGAAEQVAESCVHAILDVAYPAKIVSVTGDQVRLNRGEGGGLGIGTILNCYAAGRKLYDPDTKELLGSNDSLAGKVEVAEILPTMTVARMLDGGQLQAGDACRTDAAES